MLGESWNSKNLRNELLNKKEERDGKVIGKVKRYRPGVVVFGCLYQSEVPDFAKQKEEKERATATGVVVRHYLLLFASDLEPGCPEALPSVPLLPHR